MQDSATSAGVARPPPSLAKLPSTSSQHRSYRCSLRWVFLCSSAGQVIAACLIIWYLGYQSQIDTANSLSAQLRAQTIAGMADEVSVLLSLPELAVSQINAAMAERIPYTQSAFIHEFDFHSDYSLWTTYANTFKMYPGTTAAITFTMASALVAIVFDLTQSPPKLAYAIQDESSGWRYQLWYSSYNASTDAEQLSQDVNILSSQTTFFLYIPDTDLTTSRTCPSCLLGNESFILNSREPWYAATMQSVQQSIIAGDVNTAYHVVWLLPFSAQTVEAIAVSIEVALPHIIPNPNVTALQQYAAAAQAAGSPGYATLQANVDALAAYYNTTGLTYPFVDFISCVTFNAAVMQDFLINALPSFVAAHGAAFIVTTNGYLIASTLSDTNVNVGLNLTLFFSNHTRVQELYYTNDPSGVNFLIDVYNTLIEYISENTIITSSSTTEILRSIEGTSTQYYVQMSILPTPNPNFSFLLIMYTLQSDYSGKLINNLRNSFLLSLLVLVLSLIFTFCLTQCVHTPLMNVIVAMRTLFQNDTNSSAHLQKNVTDNPRDKEAAPAVASPATINSRAALNNTVLSSSPTLLSPSASNSAADIASRASSLATPSIADVAVVIPSDTVVSSRDSDTTADTATSDDNLTVAELTRLLHKWRRTMNAHGLATPPEWNNTLTVESGSDSDSVINDSFVSPICCLSAAPCSSHQRRWSQSIRHLFVSQCFSSSELVDLQLTFGQMLYRLRNSQLSLENANAAKRQFLRFVFHEVRVPLNALGLGVEQLKVLLEEQQTQPVVSAAAAVLPLTACQDDENEVDTPSPAVGASEYTPLQLVAVIQDQVTSVARILNDVLSFQRIEDGELMLEMNPFNVTSMIEHTMHAFQSEFKQKSLSLTLHYQLYHDDLEQLVSTFPSASSFNRITSVAVISAESKDIFISETPARTRGRQSDQFTRPDVVTAQTASNIDPATKHHPLHQTGDVDDLIQPSGLVVIGDQHRLRQVLSNFVSNAIKFTPANGALIVTAQMSVQRPFYQQDEYNVSDETAQMSSLSADNICWLSISVGDSGVGITQDNMKSLFQEYKQISPGQLQQGRGSGLGLSICKKLISLHGGQVHVQSDFGFGSTFSFAVPTNIVKLDRFQQDVKKTVYAPNTTQASRSKSVLITHSDAIPPAVTSQLNPQRRTTTTEAVSSTQRPPLFSEPTIMTPQSAVSTIELSPIAFSEERTPLSITRSLPPRHNALTRRSKSYSDGTLPLLRCLVVEDSDINRKLFIMMIHSTRTCSRVDGLDNGQLCVQRFAAAKAEEKQSDMTPPSSSLSSSSSSWEPYDIIFIDDSMPIMSGVECVERLRAMGATVAIFGVTGNALAEDQEKFLRAGANKVFTKPTAKQTLIQAIHTVRQQLAATFTNNNTQTSQ